MSLVPRFFKLSVKGNGTMDEPFRPDFFIPDNVIHEYFTDYGCYFEPSQAPYVYVMVVVYGIKGELPIDMLNCELLREQIEREYPEYEKYLRNAL